MIIHENALPFMNIYDDLVMSINDNEQHFFTIDIKIWQFIKLWDNSIQFPRINDQAWTYIKIHYYSWQFITIHKFSWQLMTINLLHF